MSALFDGLGRQQDGPDSPPGRALTEAVAALTRPGYPCDAAHLTLFARAAERTAVGELDLLGSFPDQAARVEAGVALTVLYEPVLLSLRRLAHVEESARRFGAQTDEPRRERGEREAKRTGGGTTKAPHLSAGPS
ncbi:hypothetical protein [Streptomyces sp. WMMB303]|uniref:hypothetical protein n=1 Tax=Streptomyces sp. WMMB303 TaxID=3034154 RepID=UPI0023EDB8EB|nr:hypothetical protein [Streptomyces sp. WMMB303]MDF4253213.1 hypothetical protein [Streptomyces sp. WMMB303]